MMLLIAAFLGALLNRFRGGGIFALPGETPAKAHSQIRRIIFLLAIGGFVWLCEGDAGPFIWLYWVSFTVPAYVLVPVIIAFSLLIGWGVPTGAAGGYNKAPVLEEWTPLDRITTWLLFVTGNTGKQHIWGITWMTLWGVFFGGLVALVLASCWPLAWSLIGLIYFVTGTWMQCATGNAGDGRPMAEWIFGALQGLTLAIAMAF